MVKALAVAYALAITAGGWLPALLIGAGVTAFLGTLLWLRLSQRR